MKRVKRALKHLAPKVLNFFIILLMLFQPVGTPGMLVAIAEGEPTAVVETAPEPTPLPVVEEEPASEPEEDSTSSPQEEPAPAPVVEEPAPVVETVVEEPPVVVEPIVTDLAPDPAPVTDPAPTAPGEAESPVSPETPTESAPETSAPEPKEAPTETPDETPAPNEPTEPTVPATDPTEPTSSLLPVTPLDTFVPTISILDQTSVAPTDQTCLTEGAAITTSAVSDWEVAGDVATTKEKVKLGVKYEFPGNKEVSVTFTCLPTVLSKLSPLKIEQIASDKINLPDGVSAATDFAYDITTDMENGTFEYDIALPKYKEAENVGISYIEKSAEEVTSQNISKDDLKEIDNDKVDQKDDIVKSEGIDHFTVFLLTVGNHEGQLSPSGLYSPGNITTYSEGDNINFRFRIDAAGAGSGTIEVRFSGQETACLFFEQSFSLSAASPISGSIPTVTPGSLTQDGDEWVQVLNINFSGSGAALINYTLLLSNEAGSCNGSSQHARLGDATGDIKDPGAENVPIPANAVIEIPEITIIKNIDRDGNGSFESTASAGEYQFTLDGSTTLATNSSGQVIFTSVTPDGAHSITETQLDFSQGTYTFVSGSGTNCTFNGSTATATVASGTTATDASCTFNNAQTQGSLQIVKRVINDNGGTADVSAFGLASSAGLLTFGTGTADGANTLKYSSQTISVNAGSYTLREDDIAGYSEGTWSCTGATPTDTSISNGAVTVPAGGSATCTITNDDQAGTLQIVKNTIGDDGQFDFTVTGPTASTPSITTVTGTGSTGPANVDAGTYSVKETVPSDWDLNSASCNDGSSAFSVDTVSGIEIALAQNVVCTFNNTQRGHIIVDKVTNPSQLGQLAQSFSFNTTGSGYTGFSLTDQDAPNDQSLVPGTYTVTEVLPLENWQLDSIVCLYDDLSIGIPTEDDNGKEIVLGAGDTVYCTFTNTQLSDVHGYKWNDEDGNGAQNGTEPKLAGWEIFIDENDNSLWDTGEPKTTTSADLDPLHFGWYVFDDLLPGTYKICEVQQTGWSQTFPTPPCHTITLPENGSGEEEETNLITAIPYNFGNQFVLPQLKIDKFVTSEGQIFQGDQTPGDTVTYILKIKAAGGDEGEIENLSNVNDVVVTDLPPAGFTYVPGSATLSSSEGGSHIGALELSHVYASPGEWSLGTLVPGEVVTLTYEATISGSQDAGLYNDLAWAQGRSDISETPDVLATQGDPELFAGTAVEVVISENPRVALEEDEETKTKTKTRTKRVLGAELPATGASNIWISIVAILAAIGGGLMLFGRRKKILANSSVKTIMKVFIAAVLSGTMLLLVNQAKAAEVISDDHLSVKIEESDSPMFTKNFLIGFVALNIDGNPVTVKCYEEGLGLFQTHNLAAGGGSGDCDVALSGITTDGSYKFYVTADAGSGINQTDSVEVFVDVTPPGTPLNYDRDDDSCTATFTTANDGQTVKVELYRSTETEFTVDTSAPTQTVLIGPNQNGVITDPGPNCDDYFYAIRAVDANGHGSGFVGDEDVNVRTRTRTRTRTITIRPEASGAIPVGTAGATTPGAEGTVGGAETEGGLQPGQGEEGQVLGEEGEKSLATPEGFWEFVKNNRGYFLGALLLITLLYYAYRRKQITTGNGK